MIYILVLNSIRGAAENGEPVAVSRDRQALVDWLEGEREQWQDEQRRRIDTFTQIGHEVDYTWNKSFKAGSPLEWFNLPSRPRDPDLPSVSGRFHRIVSEEEVTEMPPYSPDMFGHGIIEYPEREEAAEKARQDWDSLVNGLLQVEPVTTGA